MYGRNLSHAYLVYAVMSGGDLSSTVFAGANLTGAKFIESDLTNASFRDAWCHSANFSHATMNNAVLANGYFRETMFDYAILHNAHIRGANFTRACFSHADMSGVHGRDAIFTSAQLNETDFSQALLSGADFRHAELINTRFDNGGMAMLDETILSTRTRSLKRAFAKDCPPVGKHGGRIVYRSSYSKYVGDTEYKPGHTYIAPVLSHDETTLCHPGIYAYPNLSRAYYEESAYVVRCYVRDGDYVVCAKGIRCERLRVLDELGAKEMAVILRRSR
jgi:uncharacterized protein YjbI with pentapeptide repeats